MIPTLWVVVSLAWGGGFEVAQQGAQAGGTAHAGVAWTDRAESAWFNPAALADGRGFRATLGASVALSRVRAESEPAGAWQGTSDTPLGTPPYVGLSYAHADWAVSAAANVAYGGGIRWPADWAQRFVAIRSTPQFFRTSAAFAYRIGPVRLGAAVHVDTGGLTVERATDHVDTEGHVLMSLRGTGVGGGGFVLAELGPHATLGATYRSRTALRMKGEADFDLPAPFAATRPDQAVQAAWTLPDRIVGAFAWSTSTWGATVEASGTLWSVNDQLVFDFEEDQTDDLTQPNQWRNTAAVRAGAWGQVHDLVTLSGGLAADGLGGAPPPAHTLGPSSPDTMRLSATAGLGVLAHDIVRLDAYVEPLWLLPRTSAGDDQPRASYRGWAIAAGLGVQVRVPGPHADNRNPPERVEPAPVDPDDLWGSRDGAP